MKRSQKISLTALVLAIGVLAAGVVAANRYLDAPLQIDDSGLVYEIRSGMAFRAVTDELAELGITDRADWMRWYARLTGQAQEIRAGEYRIEQGTTARQLLEQFVAGQVQLYSFFYTCFVYSLTDFYHQEVAHIQERLFSLCPDLLEFL